MDDERKLVNLLKAYLEEIIDESLRVEITTDPFEGLEFIQKHSVDCVVCDYDMPGIDGLEFLENVRKLDSDIPFILLTGKGNEYVASEAIGLGATDYLKKPAGTKQFETLANRIDSAVVQYWAEQDAREEIKRLRTICDRVSDAVLLLDSDWRCTYANEPAEDCFQRLHMRAADTTIWEAVPQFDGTEFAAGMRRAMAEREPVEIEATFQPTGTTHLMRAFPDDGGLSVFFRELADRT